MKSLSRRTLLASSAIGGLSVAGCFGRGTRDGITWRNEPGGRVVTVHDGILYGLEDSEKGDGSVVALETMSGGREWSYGETGLVTAYTPPVVDDAVYFGVGDDVLGNGSGELYALELDGTERFTAETGSVYNRPQLGDDAVFVGTDDGRVYAFDTEDGTERWSIRIEDERTTRRPTVEAVVDGIAYVTAGGRLRALDAESATKRWQYDAHRRIQSVTIDDGVYVATADALMAVDDGDERWHVDLEESDERIADITDGTIFLEQGSDLVAFDTADGTERWRDETKTDRRMWATDDAIYFGADESADLRATNLDGEDQWTVDLEEDEIDIVRPISDAVYLATDTAVYRLERSGEIGETVPLKNVRSLVVDDQVYAGADEAFYALDL